MMNDEIDDKNLAFPDQTDWDPAIENTIHMY